MKFDVAHGSSQIAGWIRRLPGLLRRQFFEIMADISRWPLAAWIYLGFSIVFFLYFIWPTFLNPYHQLRLFPDFPQLKPLGADLREYLDFSKALVQTGTPYVGQNYYPPFESVFFLRFYQMGPDLAYIYLTVLSFLGFLGITFLFPLMSSQNRNLTPTAAFTVVTGLFSYGLWFQFERGQFDLIVMALCFAAIYLYQRHPRLRLLAYLLFIVSVQIKLYPAVFILCFAVDWHDWKSNLRRWSLLAIANLAGLFVLGPRVFMDFVNALTSQIGRPTFWGAGNHSINSFITTLISQYRDNRELYNQLKLNSGGYQLALLLVFLAFFALVLWITYRDRRSPANPYVILLCTIAAMVIPSTSHDYKLCIFAAPVVLLLNNLILVESGRRWLDWAGNALVLLLFGAYSTTLFLHTDLPLFLTSNFPALLVISAAAALLMAVRSRQARLAVSMDEFHDLNA